MPNGSTTRFNDVLWRPLPWWIHRIAVKTIEAHRCRHLVTTPAQQLHIREKVSSCRGHVAEFRRAIGLCAQDTGITEAQVCLSHGRRLRHVSRQRGDVPLHVEFCDFLSCKGTSVTEVMEEARRLAERTRLKSYTSPFWFTQPQLENHFRNSVVQWCTHCMSTDRPSVCEVYENPDTFVELGSGSAATVRYANLDEFRSQRDAELSLIACLSFLRVFSPINVHTRRAFDACVESRLRVECHRSGCWCSIWGTAEDYKKCGFSTLDSALGVDVFDALGNPMFLIHALCTTTPLRVFESCYPNDCIIDLFSL
ncbi:hypothetical protein LSCM1_04572 [Leishmania martiniquensis]|uniref:Trypanosoma Tc-38 (p38) protein domain-containing protein n=1 Tax=Leishmania martiniquensis TaxID=1580590 RepID=A0A836HA81_9TRYP|nr:hypothetical protein LSCM1_04572 [Leishmania martiniquensis]